MRQALHQRNAEDAEGAVQHFTYGLGARRLVHGLGHPGIIRAVTVNHTIGTRLSEAALRLGQASATPRLDAELLLAHALDSSRAWLVAHADDPVDTASYDALIERRAAGEPIAYILGFKEFWTLRLIVTPAVLVPRPETELLVELALCRPAAVTSVVDLGTGSGAIALALARERPNWRVAATEVSIEALAVAQANAAALDLARVELLHGSWFEPLAGRTFDLIVSNPPYIAAAEPALRSATLGHEPQRALSPGADAMACLHEIIQGAPDHLRRDGCLLLEHGATQAQEVARELVARGFSHVRSHRDLAGHERVTEAHWQ